jgi:4-diphosphocytidyl-2-C-methyl-D-erythritol kinase
MSENNTKDLLDQIRIVVSGKVNMFLRILESCTSGYHLIETYFHSIGIRDDIILKRNNGGFNLEIEPEDYRGVPGGKENIVSRAVELFFEESGLDASIDITLKKYIPVGAGLGGGSADGAAALRGLNILYGSPLPETRVYHMAGRLGSDVPFMLYGGASLAWGRGNRLLPLKTLSSLYVGICYPRFEVSSRWAYDKIDEIRDDTSPVTSLITFDKLNQEDWILSHLHNDFEEVLFPRHPELKEIKETFLGMGAAGSLLSGSGSSVFGIFRDRKVLQAALGKIEGDYPVDVYESSFEPRGMVIEIPQSEE